MNIDIMLNRMVRALRSALPTALYPGFLVIEERAFDPATGLNQIVSFIQTPVEIIFDNISSEDVPNSVILDRAVKLYIIANDVKSIDHYSVVRANGVDYTIQRKVDTVVGSRSALFTIIATSG